MRCDAPAAGSQQTAANQKMPDVHIEKPTPSTQVQAQAHTHTHTHTYCVSPPVHTCKPFAWLANSKTEEHPGEPCRRLWACRSLLFCFALISTRPRIRRAHVCCSLAPSTTCLLSPSCICLSAKNINSERVTKEKEKKEKPVAFLMRIVLRARDMQTDIGRDESKTGRFERKALASE
jgi:hypothetical protein